MPKMKCHSGAKKRFRVSKSGKVKHGLMGKAHILTKKDRKRKNNLRKGGYLANDAQAQSMRTLINK